MITWPGNQCSLASCGRKLAAVGKEKSKGSTRDGCPFPEQLLLLVGIYCDSPGKSLAQLLPQAMSAQKDAQPYQSAGAPGMPLPGAGTSTAFLSSVSPTHCSTSRASRSTSSSVFSAEQNEGTSAHKRQ